MTAEAPGALTVFGGVPPSEADVRAGRAAVQKIREEIGKLKDESQASNLDVGRKLSGDLASGNVDLLAKYREQKPRRDQVEERKAALMFFQPVVTDYWTFLKTEFVDLTRQVLIQERDRLQRDQSDRDQVTQAQIKEVEAELATLPAPLPPAPAPASSALAPEQKASAAKVKA